MYHVETTGTFNATYSIDQICYDAIYAQWVSSAETMGSTLLGKMVNNETCAGLGIEFSHQVSSMAQIATAQVWNIKKIIIFSFEAFSYLLFLI